MCGICAELRFDGTAAQAAIAQMMLPALARRGPDDEGQLLDGPLLLGNRRLAVIDLSHNGHQPMVDAPLGLALTFNGTIYNYRELRRDLQRRGYRFFSETDTEVILKAYAQWGERCPERLDGVFAFVLWDRNLRRLFAVRDRLGIKPLYYQLTPYSIRLASTTQALLATGDVDTRIDPIALHHHLTLHGVVPAPRTILRGVRKVPPATALTADEAGTVTMRSYWHLEACRPTRTRDPQEWIDAVRAALRDAVMQRLKIADVPVGVLLSGGLDSSLIVALLAESGISDLRTFSIGFESAPEEPGSEFEFSDAVAERFATRHERKHIENEQLLQCLPAAIRAMAEPLVSQDAVAFFLLSEWVASYLKVVQTGQGADEVFGGYFWYPLMESATGAPLERFRRHYFDRSHEEFLESVTPLYYGEDHTSSVIAGQLALPGADSFIDRVLRLDVTTLIVDDPVKRVDNMTMAWGLEARLPFLDQRLVELAAMIPPELKLHAGGKYPLRAIARGILPDAVIDRPKGYFPVPALKHIRGKVLRYVRDTLNSPACGQRKLFQPSYLRELLRAPQGHMTPLRGSKLWHAAVLELWLQLNVDSPAGDGPVPAPVEP